MTLETGLGRDFTNEMKDAWMVAYKIISDTMMAADQ